MRSSFVAVLLLGCSSAAPATKEAASEPETPTPAAPEQAAPPERARVVGPPIRIVYLVPTDKTENRVYVTKLERASAHLQTFFRKELGASSFAVCLVGVYLPLFSMAGAIKAE